LESSGQDSSRDAKRRYGSANVDERMEDPVAVRKITGKVAGIIYPKHIRVGRAGNIVFCEGSARQEICVFVAIAAEVVTADCAWVIDASSVGKTEGIVRFDDRVAKATIAEPDKTAREKARVEVTANDVTSVVNLLRDGRITGPGIIKSGDHFNRARVRCLLSERPHQWEHEQNCQNAVKYVFWFHDAYLPPLLIAH